MGFTPIHIPIRIHFIEENGVICADDKGIVAAI